MLIKLWAIFILKKSLLSVKNIFKSIFYLFLDFVDESFSAAPNLMLVVGTLGLFIGCLGVVVGATANRLIIHWMLRQCWSYSKQVGYSLDA